MTKPLYACHVAERGGRRPAKYREIAGDLRARIEAGEWPLDGQMPTMEQLGKRYGVAEGTIDKALGVLRELGIAETIHGMGTFVREPAPAEGDLAAEVAKLSERMKAMEQRMDRYEGSPHARG